MTDLPRKAPALEKNISQITKDDIKVRVIGEVSETRDGFFKLKDDTGEIEVKGTDNVSIGDFIRVFGTIYSDSEKVALKSELVQNMEDLDKKLYKRLRTLSN